MDDPTRQAAALRPYRAKSLTMGQTSPPALGHAVVWHVRGRSVADVGCGSGVTGYLLRAAWQFTGAFVEEGVARPDRLVGIDWSPSTLDDLSGHSPYDEVLLADAAGIPLPSDTVDTAISMEALEHLLPVAVPRALDELARIAARQVVVSTPAPWTVTNEEFLRAEYQEASADRQPMGYTEFLNLVGNLHKSSVTPEQMHAAGFAFERNRLGAASLSSGSVIYLARPEDIDTGALGEVVGVGWTDYPADDGRPDWCAAYAAAVKESMELATPRRPPWSRRVTRVARSVREALRGEDS